MLARLFRRERSGAVVSALMAIAFIGSLWSLPTAAQSQTRQGDMIHQLRIYEIFESNKAAFHARFRDHAARIMRRYDFDILAMWEASSPGRTEFVYVIQWPDQETMTDRWARFMADQEWSDIKEESAEKHGAMLGESQDRVLHLTEYSPRLR